MGRSKSQGSERCGKEKKVSDLSKKKGHDEFGHTKEARYAQLGKDLLLQHNCGL